MLNGKNKTEIMQSHGLRKSVAEMLLKEKSRPRPKSWIQPTPLKYLIVRPLRGSIGVVTAGYCSHMAGTARCRTQLNNFTINVSW